MADRKKILAQVQAYTAFQMSTNQKDIVASLSDFMREGEKISLLQEGFYNGLRITDSSTGVYGFLILSDSRLFFMSNDKKQSHQFEVIDTTLLKKVSIKKNFASVTLTLHTNTRELDFRSVMPLAQGEELARRLATLYGLNPSTENVPEQADDYRILNKPVDNTMINDFVKKINSVSKDILSNINRSKNTNDTEKDFLFQEAKKISLLLDEYFSAPTLKDMIQKDLIILSSMCTISDHELNEQETFFLALVFLALEKGKSVSNNDVEGLYAQERFSPQYQDLVAKNQKAVLEEMKKVSPRADVYPFQALSYIRQYDEREGCSHFGQMAALYTTYAQCIVKADGTVTKAEEEILQTINLMIHEAPVNGMTPPADPDTAEKTASPETNKPESEEKTETLEEVLAELNNLIGMKNIKDQISTFINLIKVQKAREEKGLPVSPVSLHAVFYGPPGTGKTTTARLLGRIYKCLGLLKQGHITETDRAGLVAGYVGQTAIKTDEIIQKSLDGILFIDEAYALAPAEGGKDFGQEAIDTLLKRMEDYRERLVIIVAGYPDEMKTFINSNPGLKSRFSRYFNFEHYTPQELIDILQIFTKKSKFVLTKGAKDKLLALFTDYYEHRDKSFGNGRLSRNLFEKIIEKQANRIAPVTPLTDKILCSIKAEDIPEKDEMVL